MGDFERASQYKPVWTRIEDGLVYSAYRFTQQLRNCVLIQTVTFYKTIKRIDVTVSLFNFDGIKSREYRLGFPLRQQNARISYEVGMGVATVGVSEIQEPAGEGPVYAGISQQWGVYKTGPTYPDQPSDVHPRTVQNFISSSDNSGGVTISTSVAAFDHVDPTTSPPISALIQPILLASRKSNHPQGNWYVQAGDHHFTFSLTSHAPGWLNGWRQGIAANTPLLCADAPEPHEPVLPAEHSFLTLSGGDVLVTALKKAEAHDALILRMCEIAGRDTPVTLRPCFALDCAERTDMLESGPITLASMPDTVDVTLGHHAIETLLLRPLRT
jgi:alpha-mannosidase